MASALMLTGITSAEQAFEAPPELKPDFIFSSLA
jgi:ribonucleotide monophosphatase NagD (HAD superfamily)